MMSNKYIIYVSFNYDKFGAEKSLVELCNYLKNNKNIMPLVIIPSHGPIEELLNEYNIEFIVMKFKNCINCGKGIRFIKGSIKQLFNKYQAFVLSKKLKNKNIIGVHTNTITTDFGYYLSKNLNTKHIWHIRELGKLTFNYDFELGDKNFINKMNTATKIICNSKTVKDYYSKMFDNNIITYVYNGINIKEQQNKTYDYNVLKMVMVGRLCKDKNQILAINLCNKLIKNNYNNFTLDFYGDGIDKNNLEKNVSDLNLNDYIKFNGYVDDIPFYKYDVGLMFSEYEAFGRVTVEYMLNKLAVVGLDSGGTSEIIDINSGFLIKNNDFDSLYDCIIDLYNNRDLCKNMGINGYNRAKKLFSLEQYCENIYKIYSEVLLEGDKNE